MNKTIETFVNHVNERGIKVSANVVKNIEGYVADVMEDMKDETVTEEERYSTLGTLLGVCFTEGWDKGLEDAYN